MVHLKGRTRNAVVPRYGNLDFAAVFESTLDAGVRHYFVEQDYSPDPLQSIRRSYAAVRKLGF